MWCGLWWGWLVCTYGIHVDDEELALGLLGTPWHKKASLNFRAVLSISQLHCVSTLFAKFCRKHISPSVGYVWSQARLIAVVPLNGVIRLTRCATLALFHCNGRFIEKHNQLFSFFPHFFLLDWTKPLRWEIVHDEHTRFYSFLWLELEGKYKRGPEVYVTKNGALSIRQQAQVSFARHRGCFEWPWNTSDTTQLSNTQSKITYGTRANCR